MKSIFIIELETEFKGIKDEDNDDITNDVEVSFHEEIKDYIDNWLMDGEDIEESIMDKLELENYDCFSKLGSVRITFSKEFEKELGGTQ